MASAFELYLRTGRRLAPLSSELETKFNPWHDPNDGRFTFSRQGNYFPGRRGAIIGSGRDGFVRGGGGFGGGGAGGSWESKPDDSPRPFRGGSSSGAGASGSWLNDEVPPETRTERRSPPQGATSHERQRPSSPRVTVSRNDYNYEMDAHARTRRIAGEIRLQTQQRSRSTQANAGKPDRRNSDHGGHFIAARFNGPREWFNHFAKDANFNRSAYRTLEDAWANAIRSGKRVFVDIVPFYRGTSMRPYKLRVISIVDGKRAIRNYPNERAEQ